MTQIEMNFIVKDTLKALADYQTIFSDIEVVEKTAFETGLNEVIFKIKDSQFHMLDENPSYQLVAPSPSAPVSSIWFNVVVDDIEATWAVAMDIGAQEIQPIITMDEMGVSNAMFMDKDGYAWMLHQIHRQVSFEEREEYFKDQFDV